MFSFPQGVDGVMIGRASYANPYLLATVDRDIHGDTAVMSRDDVVHKMVILPCRGAC